MFFFFINTLIQQGCINVIKSDRIDVYEVTKHLYFKQMLFFPFIKESRKNISQFQQKHEAAHQ